MQIYIRKAKHFINGKLVDTLDLANIQVEEEFKGKGLFTALLGMLKEQIHEVIYVECILNERFYHYLTQKQGFIADGNIPQSVYFVKQ